MNNETKQLLILALAIVLFTAIVAGAVLVAHKITRNTQVICFQELQDITCWDTYQD